jgi:hypothetical protein
MTRFLGAVVVALCVVGLGGVARAADAKGAQEVIDKAIKAAGGEEKLKAVLQGATSKGKGTISFGGNDNEFTFQSTIQGLDHLRSEFEGDFGGNKVKGVTVLAGDKGWRDFGGMKMEMDKDTVASEKRNLYLQVVPLTLVPLKSKDFKAEVVGEEKVGDKPAVTLKVTGPDGKDFKLSFDKESGLPVKLVAKVIGFMGEEFTQETAFGDYKDMGGIKKAMKVQAKRDGEKFMEQQVTEFKTLDKVDPKTFAEP